MKTPTSVPAKNTAGNSLLAITRLLCLFGALLMATAQAAITDWFKDAKYGLFFHYLSGTNDITGTYSDGSWNASVNAFDCAAFANQVEQTGAKFVVFTVGQNSGLYCTPSTTFTKYTGYTDGSFCSNRDLISDLYGALNPKGIKLIVYLAANGPSEAPGFITGPFSADGAANVAAFRERYNEMVAEWSQRWSYKVAGWWLDGCWVQGYTNPSDGSDGPTNLINLINACRGGNPDVSIVCCNPSVFQYVGLSTSQQYLAGEDNTFGRYPLSRYVAFNGVNLQWNTTSFLGTWWGRPDTAYSNEYIAKYVKSVSQNQGVVTIDCAIYRNGSMATAQFNQLAYVKSVVRDNAVGGTYNDLVRFKASHLMSNSSNNELSINSNAFYPSFGTDGDAVTYALAGGEYAWNYRVDLLNPAQYYNAGIVEFPATNFATNFKIQKSTDATTWTDVVSVPSNTSGTTLWYNFPRQTNSNYVRVIAYAPNGPNQTGGQMAVKRFELYDQTNVAIYRTAHLLSNTTGNELPVNSGIYYASNGVDGNSASYALAGNEWAWNYRVDLYQPTQFNQVKVTFPSTQFATSFTIDISDNATTWTTIKSVTGNTTGGTKTYNLSAVKKANYIRVKALAPNGPNQTGIQMAIAELALYYN